MKRVSISIELRQSKAKNSIEKNVALRVTSDRKNSYISCGIKVNPSHIDLNNHGQWITFKDHEYRLKNREIKRLYDEILKAKEQHEVIDENTAKLIKNEAIEGSLNYSVFTFFAQIRDSYSNECTRLAYATTLNDLIRYSRSIGVDELTFKRVDLDWLMLFQKHLSQTLADSSVKIKMTHIKHVFTTALKSKLIKYEDNPFLNYKMPKGKPKFIKEKLTKDELLRLLSIEKSTLSKNEKVAIDLFRLEYDSGIRIGDLINLKVKDVLVNGEFKERLNIRASKQGKVETMPIRAFYERLFKEYIGEKQSEESLFFSPKLIKRNAKGELLRQSRTDRTSMLNDALKSLAKKANINKNISTHIARHTMSSLLLQSGVNVIQKYMQHENKATTLTYTGELSRLDGEFDKVLFGNSSFYLVNEGDF